MSDLSAFLNQTDVVRSSEELRELRDLVSDDSTRLIGYLDPLLQEKQESLDRQVKAVEAIANQARSLAESTAHETDIMKERLIFAKSEAESAKKEALFARTLAILSLLVSVLAIFVPILVE